MGLEQFESVEALRSDLKGLIIETCDLKNITPNQINDEDYLINGQGALQLESIDAVDIVVAIERRYGVKITDLSSARLYMRSVSTLSHHIFLHKKPQEPQNNQQNQNPVATA